MADEIVFHHGITMVRRLCLAPGETMPWHRDPFHRVAVVLGGDVLSIEYRDGGAAIVSRFRRDRSIGRSHPSAFTAL